MRVKKMSIGPLATNCYIVDQDGLALVIDPGGDPTAVIKYLEANKLTLDAIINTHLHCDHTMGNAALVRASGATVYAGQADAFMLETDMGRGGVMGLMPVEPFDFVDLKPGQCRLAGLDFMVLATPGHSPGSLSLYFPGQVFVGDALFAGSIGRTDFPGGDYDLLINTVKRQLFTLPDDTLVYSGHGPASQIGLEKTTNPFFN